MAIESGTPELKKHHQVREEKLDSRGIFRRNRVVDQCEIDRLFLTGDIKLHQYCAGEMYMELLWRAGSFLRSPSMEKEIDVKGGDVEKSMSSRIMVVSRARSILRDRCTPDVIMAVDTCIASNKKVDLNLLREGLNVLSRHFGVDRVRDPRDI
jgi:hypothetical protein